MDMTEERVELTLLNDEGAIMGMLLWDDADPACVHVVFSQGVLNRDGLEALRNFCDTTLGCMDAVAMAGTLRKEEEA